jgi:hypothetical protein
MQPARLWLATGLNFPDALAAGPAVAARGETMLLVHGPDLAGSPSTSTQVASVGSDLEVLRLLGGTGAISADTEAALRAILREHPPLRAPEG